VTAPVVDVPETLTAKVFTEVGELTTIETVVLDAVDGSKYEFSTVADMSSEAAGWMNNTLGDDPNGKFLTINVICDDLVEKNCEGETETNWSSVGLKTSKIFDRATYSIADASKISKNPDSDFEAGHEIDAIASVLELERDNWDTEHGVDKLPCTKLHRAEKADQKLGTSVSWTCENEPKEENCEGNTDLTITEGGSVYASEVGNVKLLSDLPLSTKDTDEVRTLGTFGELKKTRSPLEVALATISTPSTWTDTETYPNAAGWMKAATCVPPNKGIELGLRDTSWGWVSGRIENTVGMRRVWESTGPPKVTERFMSTLIEGRLLPIHDIRKFTSVWDDNPLPPKDAPVTTARTLACWALSDTDRTDIDTRDAFVIRTLVRTTLTRVGTLGWPLKGVIVTKEANCVLKYCNWNRPTQVKFLPHSDDRSATNASKMTEDWLLSILSKRGAGNETEVLWKSDMTLLAEIEKFAMVGTDTMKLDKLAEAINSRKVTVMIAELNPDGMALFPSADKSTGKVGDAMSSTGNCNISEPEKISILISPIKVEEKSGMAILMLWMASGSSMSSSREGDERTVLGIRSTLADTAGPLRNLTLTERTLGPPLE
jgi:hypothetical protein